MAATPVVLEPIVSSPAAAPRRSAPLGDVGAELPPPEPTPPRLPHGVTDLNYFARQAGEITNLEPGPDPSTFTSEVLIVGAGLSGLITAYRTLFWADQMKVAKPKITIIDSALKIGGRTRSKGDWKPLNDADPKAGHVSYGGTWVMLDNHELLSLSYEMNWLPFQPLLYPSLKENALNWKNLVLHPYLLIKIRTLGSKIWSAKPGTPEEHEHLHLDKMSLETWLDQNAVGLPFPEHAKQAVRDWLYEIESVLSNKWMSAWWAARTIYMRLSHISQTGVIAPKVMRWENGTGEIVERLYSKVLALGAHIYLDTRARRIKVQEDGTVKCEVHFGPNKEEKVYQARHVVMCTAPKACSSLEWHPQLPEHHQLFGKSMRLWDEAAVQVILAWKKQWWNGKDLSGLLLPLPDDESPGVYGATMDLSDHGPHDPRNYGAKRPPTGAGVLRILVKSSRVKDPAGNLWSNEKIKESAFRYLNELARFNKKDLETDFLDIWVWNHEWNPDTQGCAFWAYIDGSYSAGVPRCDEAFPDAHRGPVHFAGSERAKRGAQWMEGAVLMGNKKAPQLLKCLYPDQFTDLQKTQYKAYIAKQEAGAVQVLRKHGAYGAKYILEVLKRFMLDSVYNVWHKIISHETWLKDAPERPPGAQHLLSTNLKRDAAVKDVLNQGESLYCPNGQFRLQVNSDGRARIDLLEKPHHATLVWQTSETDASGHYKLQLLPSGEAVVLGGDGKQIWSTGTAVPPEVRRDYYELMLKDDRSLMLFGFTNGARYVIWSSHTWSAFFANTHIREEARHFHDHKGLKDTIGLLSKKKRPFRTPIKDSPEERIYEDMMRQHEKEHEYGHMNCEHDSDLGASSDLDEAMIHAHAHKPSHADHLDSPNTATKLASKHYVLEVTKEGELRGVDAHLIVKDKVFFSSVTADQKVPGAVDGKEYKMRLRNDGVLTVISVTAGDVNDLGQEVWTAPGATPQSLAHGPFRLVMQDDRNIVVYNKKRSAVWAGHCYHHVGEMEEIYDD